MKIVFYKKIHRKSVVPQKFLYTSAISLILIGTKYACFAIFNFPNVDYYFQEFIAFIFGETQERI